MDKADRIEDRIRETLRTAVLRVRVRSGPLYTGVCLSCGERLPAPQRWCGSVCRDAWSRRC